MRGQQATSLTLIDAHKGAGRGESLKAGALVFVVVRERLGPELYRVAIGPRLLTAKSSEPLLIGSIFRARVEGQGSLLRVGNPAGLKAGGSALPLPAGDSLQGILTAAALPSDGASASALAALLRSGMAPEARALGRVRRAALKEAAEGGDLTELAARMEAKGLPSDEALLEALSDATRRGGGGEKGAGDGNGDRPSGGGGTSDGGRPGAETQVEEAELPRVLGALLRDLASRAAEGPSSSALGSLPGGPPPGSLMPGEALGLFNHLRGPEGGWVIVPFRFALDAVDFSGSFRIQLPYIGGGQGSFEAFFTASKGERTEAWSFSLHFGGGRARSLRVEAPGALDRRLFGSRFNKFAAELDALSCTARTTFRGESPGGDPLAARAGGLDLDA